MWISSALKGGRKLIGRADKYESKMEELDRFSFLANNYPQAVQTSYINP